MSNEMSLEKQVCSLELAKRLRELGVKQESLFWWMYFEPTPAKYHDGEYKIRYGKGNSCWEHISAFTVAELLNMLQVYREEYILVPVGVNFADYLAQELINEKTTKKN